LNGTLCAIAAFPVIVENKTLREWRHEVDVRSVDNFDRAATGVLTPVCCQANDAEWSFICIRSLYHKAHQHKTGGRSEKSDTDWIGTHSEFLPSESSITTDGFTGTLLGRGLTSIRRQVDERGNGHRYSNSEGFCREWAGISSRRWAGIFEFSEACGAKSARRSGLRSSSLLFSLSLTAVSYLIRQTFRNGSNVAAFAVLSLRSSSHSSAPTRA
jgi:hypothetical protein